MFGEALATQPRVPARFVLYFKGDSDRLTAESQAVLPHVDRSITGRRAGDIVGHTDTMETRDYNCPPRPPARGTSP